MDKFSTEKTPDYVRKIKCMFQGCERRLDILQTSSIIFSDNSESKKHRNDFLQLS